METLSVMHFFTKFVREYLRDKLHLKTILYCASQEYLWNRELYLSIDKILRTYEYEYREIDLFWNFQTQD